MGNIVAQLALLIWLPLSLWMGSVLPARRAGVLALMGAVLFLPEHVCYDFPALPPFDKYSIGVLSAYVACKASHSRTAFRRQNSSASTWVLAFGFVSIFATALSNTDTLHYGPLTLPGLTLLDGIGVYVGLVLRFVLPFYLGHTLFRTVEDLRDLLRMFVLGALIYVPLILFEARMSPVLHTKLYGFFQHDFQQSMRAGGFRAFVFMSHGLAVAFFVSQALTIAVGFGRARDKTLPLSAGLTSLILAVTLVTCKSMGPFLYAGIAIPVIWYAKVKTQLRVASWLSLLVLAYPLARFFDWIPTREILEFVTSLSEERSRSLEFRFNMEAILLEHALRRPYFGWGSWGRNRVYSTIDGRDLSTPDGEWILALGYGGVLGFVLSFGILLWPVVRTKAAIAHAKLSENDAQTLAMSALLLAFSGVDLIPNSLWNPLPLLLAGAVTSVAAGILAAPKRAVIAAAPSSDSRRRALSRGAT